MEAINPDRWEEVNSSHISAVGVKDDFLVVQFKNGTLYRYPGLAEHYEDLVTADSVGRYFHENVRHQACERLRGEEWPDE